MAPAGGTDMYRQARSRARRTPTFVLRRRERRIVTRSLVQRPHAHELAALAAARTELQARTTDAGRRLRTLRPWASGPRR
jgi:hypothetical protein